MQGDDQLARSAIAKMSWRLLPLIGFSYLIAYMDRANVSFASLQMNVDLGFSASVYGLGAGLFFVGYSLFEIPSNLLLVRFGARRWIARIMLTWGLISAGMIFVSTPLQFYFMRFLLGVAEAGFFPGVMLYLSYWFPARWSGRATSRFYIALPISTIIMGVLAGALLGLDGAHGLAGWQWLFLIEAIPAVAMAAVLLLVLPDSPDTVAWLTTDEKDWVRRSLAADAAISGVADHSILRAMLDPLVLGIGLAAALAFAAQNAIVYSAPKLLIDATGWSTSHVGFVVAAGGAVTVVVMLLVGASSDHRHERYLHQLSVMAATAVGVAAMALGIAPAVTVLGYFVFIAASTNFGVLNYLMVGDGIHPGARPVGFAALNTIAQVGNFLGPVLWGIAADRTGSFRFGLWSAVVCLLAAMAVVLVMRQRTLRLRFAAA